MRGGARAGAERACAEARGLQKAADRGPEAVPALDLVGPPQPLRRKAWRVGAVVTPERGWGINRSIEWSSVISYWGRARRGAVVTTRGPDTLPRAPRGRLRAPVSQGGKRVYPCFPFQCWKWPLNPLVYTASLARGAAVRCRLPA